MMHQLKLVLANDDLLCLKNDCNNNYGDNDNYNYISTDNVNDIDIDVQVATTDKQEKVISARNVVLDLICDDIENNTHAIKTFGIEIDHNFIFALRAAICGFVLTLIIEILVS